jgi:hypothetical protein
MLLQERVDVVGVGLDVDQQAEDPLSQMAGVITLICATGLAVAPMESVTEKKKSTFNSMFFKL